MFEQVEIPIGICVTSCENDQAKFLYHKSYIDRLRVHMHWEINWLVNDECCAFETHGRVNPIGKVFNRGLKFLYDSIRFLNWLKCCK